MINIPWWENTFNITPLSKTIGPSNPDKIIYIGANYRANPQFSFYYKGLDLGWKVENSDYKLLLTRKENILDTINKDYDYHNYILRRGINEVKYYICDILRMLESPGIFKTDIHETSFRRRHLHTLNPRVPEPSTFGAASALGNIHFYIYF